MGFHGLLREEELLADLAIDETVGNELEYLELAGRRILHHVETGGWVKGDDDA